MTITVVKCEPMSVNKARVTLAAKDVELSQQIETLQSAPARNAAIEAASKQISGSLGISRTAQPPSAYNYDGKSLAEVQAKAKQPLPPQSPKLQVDHYRVSYEVTASNI